MHTEIEEETGPYVSCNFCFTRFTVSPQRMREAYESGYNTVSAHCPDCEATYHPAISFLRDRGVLTDITLAIRGEQ